jgi:hypothetical protein
LFNADSSDDQAGFPQGIHLEVNGWGKQQRLQTKKPQKLRLYLGFSVLFFNFTTQDISHLN